MSDTGPASLDDLRHEVAATSDYALLRIVRLLDSLPRRPEPLSALLSDALPRLRALRPARPLRLARLLFLPHDGVIVRDEDWQGQATAIPRRVLMPIADALRAAMDAGEVAELEARLEGCTVEDIHCVGETGLVLWRRAAELAPGLRPPLGCPLDAEAFTLFTTACARVWAHADGLWQVLSQAQPSPPPHLVRNLLRAAAPDPDAVRMILAALFHGVPAPGTLATAARLVSPEIAASAEDAIDQWLARHVAAGSAPAAALADLERHGWLASDARRAQAQILRGFPMASGARAQQAGEGASAPISFIDTLTRKFLRSPGEGAKA